MGKGYMEALNEVKRFENLIHETSAQIHTLVNRNKVLEHRIDSECRNKIVSLELTENTSKRKESDTKAALIRFADESTGHVKKSLKAVKDPNFERTKDEIIAELGASEANDADALNSEGLSPGRLIVKIDEETDEFDKAIAELEHAFLPPALSGIIGKFSGNFRKDLYRRILRSAKRICSYSKKLGTYSENPLTELCEEVSEGKALAEKERARKLDEAGQKLVSRVNEVLCGFAGSLDRMLETAALFSGDDMSFDIGSVTVRAKDCDLLSVKTAKQATGIKFENSKASLPFRVGGIYENLLFAADSGKHSAEVLGMLAGKLLGYSERSEIILVDIKGLGSTYPELMPLAKYAPVKVWNSEEKVIQGLARLEGCVAECYSDGSGPKRKYVFINDLLQNLPTSCYERLIRIIENGNPAGVYVIAAFNPDMPGSNRNVNEFMSAVKPHMVNVPLKGNVARISGSAELSFYTSLAPGEKKAIAANLAADAEKRKIIPIGPTLPAARNWQRKNSSKEIRIPIGVGENGKTVYLIFSAQRPYAMVIGDVRVGKSSLLHSIIIRTLADYSPNEVRLAVGDFKYGADFNVYAKGNLKSFDAVINSEDPDSMMSFLQHYLNELYARRLLFSDMSDASGEIILKYEDYRRAAERFGSTVPALPRILILIDEFQNVFDVPACAQLMTQLVQKGATYGLHVVLSGQRASSDNPRNGFTSGLKDYFTSRFVFMTPQTAARSMLSERCADTGRENSGIQRAPLLSKGQAVYNTYLGQNEADNVVLQCYFASTDVIGAVINAVRRINGQGDCVLLERNAKSVRCPDKADGLLRIGSSVMLHRDNMGRSHDFIIDDTEVILKTDRAKNILLSGADERIAESLLMSLFIWKMQMKGHGIKLHIFGSKGRMTSYMAENEDIYLHRTIDEQLEEINRQISEADDAYNINFFVEPDNFAEYGQGSGSLRNSAGADKLKKLLSRTEEGFGFGIVYVKSCRSLRNSMPYVSSMAPVNIVAVGDAENVRAALSDNFKAQPDAFDIPSSSSIKAYYCNRETGKAGKVILYAP